MEMKTHSRSAGNDQHRARIKNRVSFSLFHCHALIFIYSYALLAAVLLLLNTAAANECWIELKRARAREKKSSLLFRSKAPIYWRATVSPAVIYSYYVTVAWFLYYYFFCPLSRSPTWLAARQGKVFDDNFTFSSSAQRLYLCTSFYQFLFAGKNSSTREHCFTIALFSSRQYEFEYFTVRRSQVVVVINLSTTYYSQCASPERYDNRDANLSLFCKMQKWMSVWWVWRKCRAHCALLRPMHKCNNNTMDFCDNAKEYNNLLFRFLFRPQCLAMVHLIPFGVELGNNRG